MFKVSLNSFALKTIRSRLAGPGPAGSGRRVFGTLLVFFMGLSLLGLIWAAPGRPQPAASAAPSPANMLRNLKLDSHPDYTQLTFYFQNPLNNYVLRRKDLNTLVLDFGAARSDRPAADPGSDPLLAALTLSQNNNNLLAEIKIKTAHYTVRHYPVSNRRGLVLELKALEPEIQLEEADSTFNRLRWLPPTAHRVAKSVRHELQKAALDGESGQLLRAAVDHMVRGHYPTASAMLEAFKTAYPRHPLIDRAYCLAVYARYESRPREERFDQGLALWRETLDKFPESDLAPSSAFSLALAYLELDYLPEAEEQFKRISLLYPDSPYAQLGLVYAADVSLRRNRPAAVREILKSFLDRPLKTDLDLEAYARIGLSYYYEGLYSQANEIFKKLLELEMESYQGSPELIYALGDGYFYLGRPDLSRLFLLHAVNLLPRHPQTGVMMAKIGDTFRLEGRHSEAIAVYTLTAMQFAREPGGLVSQMRLAEMGVLSGFFPVSTIFDALRNGSHRAAGAMYEQIANNAQGVSDTIRQLALLRGGLALEADRDFRGAIQKLGELAADYPKSLLAEEARQALGRSVLGQARLFEQLSAWPDLIALSQAYEPLLEPEDQNELKFLAAKAYDALGDFDQALPRWLAFKSQRPERLMARDMAVITDLLKLSRPLEALDNLKKLAAAYPQLEDWAQTQLDTIEAALARPASEAAIDDLKLFRSEIRDFNLRQRALADSIAIALLNGNYHRGRALIDQYLNEYPDDELNPGYILAQAEIDRRLRNIDRAWDTLSDFRRQNPDDPRARETLLAQIEEASGLNRPDDAFRFIELYRSLHPQDPQSQELLMARFQKEMELGRTDQALQTLARFRTDYPQSPRAGEAYYRQHQEEIKLGRLDQAAQSLRDFRKEHPGDARLPDLMLEQAQKELEAGQPEKAFERWRDFRKTYPDDPRGPEILLRLAREEGALGRPGQAAESLAEFRRAYPGAPEEAQTYLEQLAWEERQQNHQGLISLYEEFRHKFPDHPETPRLYRDAARLQVALGRPAEALATLEEGVKKLLALAQSAEVQEQLGQIYLDQGDVEGWALSLDNYLQQPAQVGDRPEDRFLKALQLAQVYLELGRHDDARRIMDMASGLETAGIAPEALYNLAKAYETLGERAKYAGALERLARSSDDFWRGAARQELNNLKAPERPEP